MPAARQASTTSGPKRLNGPTVLHTTDAPLNSSVSEAVSWATSTTSWSAVSMPATWDSIALLSLAPSRPAAMKGTWYSLRYSQIRRPV